MSMRERLRNASLVRVLGLLAVGLVVLVSVLFYVRQPALVWESIKFGRPQVHIDKLGVLDARIVQRTEIYCDGALVEDSEVLRLHRGKTVRISGTIELADASQTDGVQYALMGSVIMGACRRSLGQLGWSLEGSAVQTSFKNPIQGQHSTSIDFDFDYQVPDFSGEATMAIGVQLEKRGYRDPLNGWPFRTLYSHPILVSRE